MSRYDRLFTLLENKNYEAATKLVNLFVTKQESLKQRLYCAYCKEIPATDYQVKDSTWAEAGMKKEGFLCLPCLEIQLNRQLLFTDFPNYPINATLRHAFIMGRKSTQNSRSGGLIGEMYSVTQLKYHKKEKML